MKKAVIWGAGQVGIQTMWHVTMDYELIGFIDSDVRRQTSGGGEPISYNNRFYEVYPPDILKELEFDRVFIANMNDQTQEIIRSLESLQIPSQKIDTGGFGKVCKFSRLNFIKTLSIQFQENNISGAVAEFGVWRGETARYINEYFKADEFYLLDTFEGFNEKDISKEIGISQQSKTTDFSDTSLEFVKNKMPYLQTCHFVKGYFPESATYIPKDEKFKFVNIDVDLYQPILEGLRYFYPRLVTDGVILIHDYFHPYYVGAKRAVDEFAREMKVRVLPIGDAFSVMIQK